MKRSILSMAAAIGLLAALTGQARAQGVFHAWFDEWGTGYYEFADNPGVFFDMPSAVVPDPTSPLPAVLAYRLPSVVSPGDVGFFEPDDPVQRASDGFRFLTIQNEVSYLIFYSDQEQGGGDGAPADSGLPDNFQPNPILPETGIEGDNWCIYHIPGNNEFNGLSDGRLVPEPASMAVLGLGALALIRRRRSK